MITVGLTFEKKAKPAKKTKKAEEKAVEQKITVETVEEEAKPAKDEEEGE